MDLPFLSTPDKPLMAPTQERIPIADITEDVVVYKDGGAAILLESTSLNFGLLSKREQQAVIASYAGLLNSFNFPVQIVARTQRKDISSYMKFLARAKKKITNPHLSLLMNDYEAFIVDAVKKKNVLSKKFYLVVPFTPYELGVAKSFVAAFTKRTKLRYPKSYVIKKAKIALYPKRDHLMRQSGRMGIELKQLLTADLIDLYYHLFNPEPPLKKEEVVKEVEIK